MNKRAFILLTTTLLFQSMPSAVASDAQSIEELRTETATLRAQLAKLEQKLDKQIEEAAQKEKEVAQKKKRNLKLTGDARIRAIDNGDGYKFEQRLRLVLEKPINDKMNFKMRAYVMNENELGTTGKGDTQSKLDNAYLEYFTTNAATKYHAKIGRFGQSFGATKYWSTESSLGMYDGIEIAARQDKFSAAVGFGDWGGVTDKSANKLEENLFLRLQYQLDRQTSLHGWWIKETSADESLKDYDVKGIGIANKLSDDWKWAFDYSKNSGRDSDPSGKVLALYYKNADYQKPGSYEIRAYYRDIEKGNMAGTTNSAINLPMDGIKGPGLSFHYVPIENVMAEFLYSFQSKDAVTDEEQADYYRFHLNWKF